MKNQAEEREFARTARSMYNYVGGASRLIQLQKQGAYIAANPSEEGEAYERNISSGYVSACYREVGGRCSFGHS